MLLKARPCVPADQPRSAASPSERLWSRPTASGWRLAIAQRIDKEGEGRRGKPTARIIEMIAGERRAPVAQHRDKPAGPHQRCEVVVGQAGETDAAQGGIDDHA